jgi:hypothetical protein
MADQNQAARAAGYRETAQTLRQVADQLRFELGRRDQLLALADGFERLAERIEAPVFVDTD